MAPCAASDRSCVLMLTPHLVIGGLERMILSLCRAVKDSARWTPLVFAYDQRVTANHRDLTGEFAASQIDVEVYRKPAGVSWRVVRRLLCNIKRNKVNVVHTHNLGSLIYASLAKLMAPRRFKIVHTQHSFVHLKEKRRYALYERFFTRFADIVTVVSEDTKRTYLKLGLPEAKIEVIENGVYFQEHPVFDRRERIAARPRALVECWDDRVSARAEQSIADYWVLFMARLHPEKGQRRALEIWERLDARVRRQVSLFFVGPEAEAGEFDRLAALIRSAPDSEKIYLMGPAAQPELWLSSSDIFLSCSEFEGMPLGPIEAVGAGLPVLLSQIPGHAFLASFTEQYELDAPAQGARALELIVQRVEQEGAALYQELWNRSRPLTSRCSLEEMARKYVKVYDALARTQKIIAGQPRNCSIA